ncbi:metallophosphoesterase [Thermophilibacter provencensis]|uniref:Metallophosphoesterase n=1 Tax=Thermophilibacter provencensis TaxID=1852386 RepID=A0ABT7V4F7_9ACTN|nr:metallophosphoesterase [Thermophilibacter provencensis]MDM8270876.1 metallophosphoesterase [Thermophilibacter provencensis]
MKNSKRWLSAACAIMLAAGVAAAAPAVKASAAEANSVERVSLEIGATETQRNFNWLGTTAEDAVVQVAVKPANWTAESAFPTEGVTSATAEVDGSELDGLNSFKATVDKLQANTDYIYRVGNDDCWSETYEFSTGNLGDGESFSFMFAGDPQIGASGDVASDTKGWTNTLDTMTKAFPETDFMISLGDQVNTRDVETIEEEYEGFFAPEVLHSITLATNVGNHDTYNDNQHYSYNYNMPNVSELGATENAGDASGDYWYTYNGVLFMSLNSNNMSTSEHRAFMMDAIAQNPDANWKIVTFHHSVYSVADHTADSDILQRRSELPVVFSQLGIDAVLMGHDHVYTRTYLMDGTTPNITDEVQDTLTNPESGEVLYITANSASGSKYYEIQNLAQNTFSAVQDQSQRQNMSIATVTEDSITFTTYYTDDAQVTEDDILDQVTIERAEEPAESEVMYRLYNQYTAEHLYTASVDEKDSLAEIGWTVEGEAWVAPTEGAEVYRLFNPYADDHHYTMSVEESDKLEALGWQKEGVAWHSADKDDENAAPLYRLFNPYEDTATHLYTADTLEYDALEELGWQKEGIAWYGLNVK